MVRLRNMDKLIIFVIVVRVILLVRVGLMFIFFSKIGMLILVMLVMMRLVIIVVEMILLSIYLFFYIMMMVLMINV